MWQILQHALAKLVLAIFKDKLHSTEIIPGGYEVHRLNGVSWGVSLGKHIIVSRYASRVTIQHEMGHSIQSKILGPLYLLIVGLPSIVMNIMTRAGILSSASYYKRWPENWADKLGGVKRRN